jgi:creatinine amidohydrolase
LLADNSFPILPPSAQQTSALFVPSRGEKPMKFHEMTFPQIREVPRDRCVVLAPIAACEQHSRHLATFTDTILVTGVADGVEARLSGAVLQLPTTWFGASHHHLRFGATLSARVDTHVTLLCDLLEPLLEDGFQRIMILNGHGGNIDTMQVALRRLQPVYRNRILSAASYWDLASRELAALAEGPRKSMGHACEFETSMMLALRPDLVRREEIRDDVPRDDPVLRGIYLAEDMFQRTDHGAVGYPERASAEKGRAFLAAAIDRTVVVVQALLGRPLPK